MNNPLPTMTYLEQALQFKVDVLGPLGGQAIGSVLEPLGFELNVNWMRKEPSGEWLEAKSFNDGGEGYLLVYNRTQLSTWRKSWQAHLMPGEASYRSE